ncbi:class I SAM-dependent methyltransferase [Buttiauxella gaviniae]|uniref:class I SAM-dependent methyltransferase n=1 Tax=Buttiauxella gaviniae TaxID=82990 RepID=UPI00397581EE
MKIRHADVKSICKVCNSEALLYGVIDFNDVHGRHQLTMQLSGHPITYHKCERCGLIFTNAFDDWSESDFSKYIYNDDYIKIDPDFPHNRPVQNFNFLMENFEEIRNYHLLDYGCGSNKLVGLLKDNGVGATGWDPFYQSDAMPDDRFDFIVSFEVMEHTPNPVKTVSLINDLLDNQHGKCFFSTLNNDNRLSKKMNDWYILPRAGHVTYYSRKSLDILFNKFDMRVFHISDGLHLALKMV